MYAHNNFARSHCRSAFEPSPFPSNPVPVATTQVCSYCPVHGRVIAGCHQRSGHKEHSIQEGQLLSMTASSNCVNSLFSIILCPVYNAFCIGHCARGKSPVLSLYWPVFAMFHVATCIKQMRHVVHGTSNSCQG